MAIALDISWVGRDAKDYSRVFAVAASVDNFRPVLTNIASEVIGPSIAANFEQGGRPAWKPLAASTVEKKARQGARDPNKILVHSGALEAAATNAAGYRITNESLEAAPFGIPYWGYHQTGSGVPKRVIMMLQAADRSKITRLMAMYIRTYMSFDPNLGGRAFTGGGI